MKILSCAIAAAAAVASASGAMAQSADVFMLLFIALCGMMMLPAGIVIGTHVRHGEAIKHRVLRQGDARHLARAATINDGGFRAGHAELALLIATFTSQSDARFQREILGVAAGTDLDGIA